MKTFLCAMCLAALASCSTGKELQVDIIKAELVKIDIVHRQPYDKKMLTWRDENNIEYISYGAMDQIYALGTTMMLLRQR